MGAPREEVVRTDGSTLRSAQPPVTTWDQAPLERRYIEQNLPLMATLASIGVHVVAPAEWLTMDGPGSICTMTSTGMGGCFRLNTAMAGTGDIGAYAPPGTIEAVRVVLQPDGGAAPRDLVVIEQVGFPGLGVQVELGGSLDAPTAEVIRN